jgi:hypothetical protein
MLLLLGDDLDEIERKWHQIDTKKMNNYMNNENTTLFSSSGS